jgi:uncharacterized protein
MTEQPFWRRKTLREMTLDEWESLCDGCAKCCLEKLENEDTGEVSYTEVGCRLLDVDTCRCNNYFERTVYVADCVELTSRNVSTLRWLPITCAYKLVNEGRDLPWWHYLVSGDRELVHKVKMSVRGRAIPEALAGDLEDHIVTWPEVAEPEKGGED